MIPTTLDVNNSIPQPAPHSIEAEQAVLGAVLLDNSALLLARDLLTPGAFYRTGHQVIFQTMLSMADGGQSIDNITLTEALNGNGKLASIGGAGYLAELLTAVSSSSNILSHARLVAEKARIRTLRHQLIDTMHSIEHGAEWEALATMVVQLKDLTNEITPASDGMRFRRADTIIPRPIQWLWPGRIARGKSSLIAGHPGYGKSQVAVSMTATVSTGGTFPTAGTACEAGNIIILSAEDGAEDTLRPRLEAAGADLSRVFIIDAVGDRSSSDGTRAFDLKQDLGKLSDMIQAIGGAALIVIDPISAYLGGTDSHKNAEVRSLLTPLSSFAELHGVAVVGISHFNKNAQTEAIMRITGSLAFVAAARSAYVVVQDPENEARRLFLPLKNNLGADRGGLAFSVEPVQLESPEGLIKTSRVLWEVGEVTITAREAMSPPLNSEEQTELESAKGFLLALLADGPVSSKQIRADVVGAGHSWGTIRRAQDALKIIAFKTGKAAGWAWRLPTEGAHTDPKMLIPNGCAPSTSSGANEHLQASQVPVKAEDAQGPPKMLMIMDETPLEHLQNKGDSSLEPPPQNGNVPQEPEGEEVPVASTHGEAKAETEEVIDL